VRKVSATNDASLRFRWACYRQGVNDGLEIGSQASVRAHGDEGGGGVGVRRSFTTPAGKEVSWVWGSRDGGIRSMSKSTASGNVSTRAGGQAKDAIGQGETSLDGITGDGVGMSGRSVFVSHQPRSIGDGDLAAHTGMKSAIVEQSVWRVFIYREGDGTTRGS
jgi:hypothetical protein